MTVPYDNRLSFLQIVACGGISGIIGRTFTAPLDVLKILTQIGVSHSNNGILNLASTLHLKTGLRGFWRGNLAGCLKLFPHSAIQFTTFNQFKWTFSDDLGRLGAQKAIVAGTLAGVNATLVTYPLDLIKTRLIAQPFEKAKRTYSGVGHAFITIARQEGLFALYHGFPVTLAGSIPYAASTYAVYELLDLVWMKSKHRLIPLEIMMQGSLASSLALTMTFPFDVIRKKMQAKSQFLHKGGAVDIKFTTGWDCFKSIVIKNGRRGLWKGLLPAIIRVAPYNGFMFMSYELCKRISLFHNGYQNSLFEKPQTVLDQNLELDEMQDISDYDIELDLEVLDDSEEDS